MSALWLDNLLAYSVQFGALVLSAVLAARVLGLEAPRVSLRLWQALALVAIGLPLVQPWANASAGLVAASLTFATDAVTPAFPPPDPIGLPASLLLIVAIGAELRLAWLAVGLFRLRALARDSSPFDALPDFAGGLQRELGTRASIRISDELEGPATIGGRHPVLLIPRRVLELPAGIQRAILCHELLHVQRRDWWHTLAEEIGCAVLWFHPAARLLASRLNLARESLVDLQTITRTADRRTYAEALLAFADAKPARVSAVTPFIRRRHLAQRIALVLQEVPMSRSRVTALTCACVFLVSLSTAAAVFRFPLATAVSAQTADKVYKIGDAGTTPPKVLKEVKPRYTPEAMKAKIQGSIWMEIVVLPSGDVGDIQVTRSLDKEYGLDDQAIKAAGQWKFEPGKKDGKPVPVQVTLELTFTLRK